MALTKQTILESVSEKLDLKPTQAKDVIEELLEIMKSTLASEEDVMISGFGKFQVNKKSPRKGRNPELRTSSPDSRVDLMISNKSSTTS